MHAAASSYVSGGSSSDHDKRDEVRSPSSIWRIATADRPSKPRRMLVVNRSAGSSARPRATASP